MVFKKAMWAIMSAKASCLFSTESADTCYGTRIDSNKDWRMSRKTSWFSISVQMTNATGTKNLSCLDISTDLLFSSSEDPSPDFAPLSLNCSPDWSPPTAYWISLDLTPSSESVPKAGNPKFEGHMLSTLDGDRNEALPFFLTGGRKVSRSSFYSSGSSITMPN